MMTQCFISTRYMKYTTKKTEDTFRASIDKWGDSYLQDATEQSLREVETSWECGILHMNAKIWCR